MRHEWDFPTGSNADESVWVSDMNAALEGVAAPDILAVAHQQFGEKLALVSSFGADSVVLLHMAAEIDRGFPVVFLDTGKLFGETIDYQETLARKLGLTALRRVTPDATLLRLADKDGDLHRRAPDDCCHIRKTLLLEVALGSFEASVTGRKRYQTKARRDMPVVDVDHAGRVRFNPLAAWGSGDVAAYMDAHELPRHPLVAKGYASIGCSPCTSRVAEGEDPRAGRWRDEAKSECGIHFGPNGVVRAATASQMETG